MGRTIIVGDVHGCALELGRLFSRLGVSPADRVFMVGDLVARGPDSRGVLALVSEVRARSVLGNHELRLLRARQSQQRGRRPRLSETHYSVYCQLQPDEWDYLAALPLSLDLPDHGLTIVHAGVLPGVPMAELGTETLCFIRGVTKAGEPSDRNVGRLWGAVYQGPRHIVFGHNSRAGLQLHDFATGLDTGCVYGGRLSALVLQPGQRPPGRQERAELIVSEPAAQAYYSGRP